MTGKINVLNYTENEDGTANIEIEADQEAQKVLADLGVQLIMLCAAFEVTTEDMISKIIEVYEGVDNTEKLTKAIEALEGVKEFVDDLYPHTEQGTVLVPRLAKAVKTLEELKQ